LTERIVVRAHLMRNTVHLVTAADFISLLSIADLSRVIRGTRPVPLPAGPGATTGTVLIEGFWAADWTITPGRDRAVLKIRPFAPLGASGLDAIAAEGGRVLEFAAPAAAYDVRITPVS
jgi:hypothetical protein